METIAIYSKDEALVNFVEKNKEKIASLQETLCTSSKATNIFVMDYQEEEHPQLIAVNDEGKKLAHIKLSEPVISGSQDALIYLDSPEYFAGDMKH